MISKKLNDIDTILTSQGQVRGLNKASHINLANIYARITYRSCI